MISPHSQIVSQNQEEFEKLKHKYKTKKSKYKNLKKSYKSLFKEKEELKSLLKELESLLKEKEVENKDLRNKISQDSLKSKLIEKELQNARRREKETDKELRELREMYASVLSVNHSEEIPIESYDVCGICKENIVPSNSMIFVVSGCEHKIHFECIQDYVGKALSDRSIVPLKCLEECCTSTISAENLATYGLFGESDEDYRKYERWEIENLSQTMITCPHCQEKMENEQTELTDVICPNCGERFCAKCHVKWSEHRDPNTGNDYTCEEYQNRHELALRQLIAESGWKQCPSCNEVIEKKEGCYHIHCNCGADFCYICGDSIDNTEKHYSEKHPLFTEQDILRE